MRALRELVRRVASRSDGRWARRLLARTDLAAAIRARPPVRLLGHQVVARPRRAIARLQEEGWVVRGHAFPIAPPIDWSADPFGDRNWCFQLSAMYFVVPFLQVYEQERDTDALAFARRALLDWATYNLIEDRQNPYRWYDFAAGMRAAHLAYVIDRSLRDGEVPPAELELLLRAARTHLRHLHSPAELSRYNHAYFQLAGLAGLCTSLPELPRARRARDYAARRFGRLVASQFTSDAIHTENSPTYHGFALQTISVITETGWLRPPDEATSRLERAWENLPWLVRPDGLFATIGDSQRGPTGFLRRGLEARGLSPPHGHRAFHPGGYAVVRAPGPGGPTSDGYLFLTAAYHSRAHKHRDALSFEWFDRGAPRLVDSGVFSNNRGAKRQYVRSTRAHNTVEIDGGDVDGGPPRVASLLATAQAGALFAIAAEVEHPELAVRHRRILLYQPGAWLLVRDELDADRDRTCTAWFHLAPDAPPVAVHDLTGEATVERSRGATEPRLQGWTTASYGKLVPSDAIGLTRSGRRVTFKTLCLLDDPGDDPPAGAAQTDAEGGAIDLTWRRRGATHGAVVSLRDGALALTIV